MNPSKPSQEEVLVLYNHQGVHKDIFDKFYGPEKNLSEYTVSDFPEDDKKIRESLEMLCCAIGNYAHLLTIDQILPVVFKVIQNFRQEARDRHLDPLACPCCFGVPYEPVTNACGHTYCKACLLKDLSTCVVCHASIEVPGDANFHTNVLAASLVQKLWPNHVQAAKIRTQANSFFRERNFPQALELYTEAINLGKCFGQFG